MKKIKSKFFKPGDLIEIVSSFDEDVIICELSEHLQCGPQYFTSINTGCVGVVIKIDTKEEPHAYHVLIGEQNVVLYKGYMRKII